MIQIKTFFIDWKEVTKEEAKRYIEKIAPMMIALTDQEKIDFINKKRLRGITYEELFEEVG